jgi:hypothetical protein
MSIVKFEEETQDSVWNLTAQRLLEVDLVTIDHFTWILSSPRQNNKSQVILNHRNHSMRNVFLLFGQTSINVLLKFLRKFLDDCSRVTDLLTIEFDKRKLSFF